MNPKNFLGQNMTTPAKITSGIISLFLLIFLYGAVWLPQIPKYVITPFYLFLGWHIINQLYVAIDELNKND